MEAFTWAQLGVIVAIFGLVLTGWKIRQVDRKYYDDKIDRCERDLAAFKLNVAMQHPTMAEFAGFKTELLSAMNRLTDRIDRVLERDA